MSKVIGYEPCPRCRSSGRDTRGDNLVVYKDDSAHCFSCQYHRNSSVRHLFEPQELNNVPKSLLPSSFTREVPVRAWQWLLQYGLPYSYWKHRCGFAPSESRLVFTVGEPLAFSIGRLIPEVAGHEGRPTLGSNEGTKLPSTDRVQVDVRQGTRSVVSAVNQGRKWFVWGDSHKHCEVITPDSGPGKTVVLVEDIVSAHKVGQVTTAIPLFGTVVHPCHLYYLMQQDKPITLWLDKDQEQNVQKTALRLQSLVSVPVNIVITDDDPKAQPFEMIRTVV